MGLLTKDYPNWSAESFLFGQVLLLLWLPAALTLAIGSSCQHSTLVGSQSLMQSSDLKETSDAEERIIREHKQAEESREKQIKVQEHY